MENKNYSIYTHVPLAEGDIRLVDLLSGPKETLQCQLRHVPSQDAEYTALSYVWRDAGHGFSMVVADAQGRIPLTENLYNALQDLRNCDDVRPKTFWIDQICINQNDDDEKGTQVRMMGDIYRRASQVLTYLGPEIPGDDDAINLALSLYQQYKKITKIYGRTKDEILSALTDIRESNRRQEGLPREMRYPREMADSPAYQHLDRRIISTDWLTRLWLVQENVLNHRGGFLRGVRLLPWHCFGVLCELSLIGTVPQITREMSLYWIYFTRSMIAASRHERANEQDQAADPTIHLYGLMRLFSWWAQCREKVDKIYGVLGLADDADELGIVPNYTDSPAQVFTDLAVRHINMRRMRGRVDWLMLLEFVGRDGPHDPTFPSWVPDSASEPCTHISVSYLDTVPIPEVDVNTVDFESSESLTHSILVVKGITFGTLERKLGELDWRLSSRQSVQSWKNVKAVLDNIITSLGNDDEFTFATVSQTLMLDECWPHTTTEPISLAAQALREVVHIIQCLIERSYEQPGTERTMTSIRKLNLGGCSPLAAELIKRHPGCDRSFNLTDDGHLASAPKRAQHGDVLVRLAGAPCQIQMLRPCGTTYKYIGIVFVHGHMRDEFCSRKDKIATYRIV